MKKFKIYLLFLYVFMILGYAEDGVGKIKFLTENSLPFNYLENNQIKGAAADTVRELLKRVDMEDNIEVVMWADAYEATKNGENYALFSTARSQQRENLFKWVGPLYEYKSVLFAKKGSKIKISTLEDAKRVKFIGTYKEDYMEQMLKNKGFSNLKSSEDDYMNASLLIMGEIDLWIAGEAAGKFHAKRIGIEPGLIEPVFTIGGEKNYIAFSKNVDDKIIEKFQKALDEMKKDGTYDAIWKGY